MFVAGFIEIGHIVSIRRICKTIIGMRATLRKKQKRKTRRRSSQRGGNTLHRAIKGVASYMGLRTGPKALSKQKWVELRDSIKTAPSSGCDKFTAVQEALDAMRSAGIPDDDSNMIEAARFLHILNPDNFCREPLKSWAWVLNKETGEPTPMPPRPQKS
jgi:hypothetical protein